MPTKITSATLFAIYYLKMVSRSLKLLLNSVNGDNLKSEFYGPQKYHFMTTLSQSNP
jgi:hypothetical protein